MNEKNITILIPAYNPTNDLITLTNELVHNGFKVVVVNDGSNEITLDIFKKLNNNVTFIEHTHNMGKGKALKTGFEYIYNNMKCSGVITADADGQHLAKDIINIAKCLSENPSSVIIGSRKQDRKMMLRSRIGNSITRKVFKLVTNTSVYDTQSGLRGIPYSLLPDMLKIDGDRYEYEINMLLYLTKNKIDIKEINITTVYIDNNKASSFNVVKDSIKIYKCMLKDSNILTTTLYIFSAILSFLIDFIFLIIFNNIISIENKDINLLICVILARLISSIFNFTFNRKIVFKSNNNFFKSLLEYYVLVILVLAINYLLLDVLAVKLNLNLKLSKIIVEFVLFIINYIIQKTHIFKKIK